MNDNIVSYVLGEAAKSNVEKRKVGCVILNNAGEVIGTGFNTEEVHAEIAAIKSITVSGPKAGRIAYVSHPPCPACAKELLTAVDKVEVVEAFIKFDSDKPRYDLVPPSAIKAMAEVLTFGARKYKPNNWKQCRDVDRYVAAAMRHFEAYRAGEYFDQDSGLSHLSHAMTNISFLIELTAQTEPDLS